MSRTFASACLALLLTAAPGAIRADTPTTKPVPAATAGPDACPITVLAVLPVGGPAGGTTYAAFLSSPDGPGEASGTLWVNTPGGAFHVPFAGRGVTNRPYTDALDPIVFRLPAPQTLDNVFVDSLNDPQPGPCAIANTWVPGITAHLVPDLLGRLRRTLANAAAPIDANPIDDPAMACRSGGARATVIIPVPPSLPAPLDPQMYAKAEIFIRVRLAANSALISAEIDHARGIANNGAIVAESYFSAPLRAAALNAAKQSSFITATVNCRPHASDYMYIVEFE